MEEETTLWARKIKKLTSVKHRNVILRTAHGDIMTKARAFKFGLDNDMFCPDCEEVENLNHFLLTAK